MKSRDLLRRFPVQEQHRDRRFAMILSGKKSRLGVRVPRKTADRPVEVNGRVPALAELSLINNQRLLVGFETGASHRSPRDVLSVRRIDRRVVVPGTARNFLRRST